MKIWKLHQCEYGEEYARFHSRYVEQKLNRLLTHYGLSLLRETRVRLAEYFIAFYFQFLKICKFGSYDERKFIFISLIISLSLLIHTFEHGAEYDLGK